MNDKARASIPATTWRRRRRGERSSEPFAVAGWELLGMGSVWGLLVGGSLGWAAWVGYIEPVRSSLALLATAAVVVVVLGADALRHGGERGFATAARRTFGGTALWVTVFGTMAVVFTAAALPWLGPPGPWFGPSELEAVVVGVVGFILGCILGAPLVLALNDVLAQGREDRHPEEDPPTSQQSTGMKARAGSSWPIPTTRSSTTRSVGGSRSSNSASGSRRRRRRLCGRLKGAGVQGRRHSPGCARRSCARSRMSLRSYLSMR